MDAHINNPATDDYIKTVENVAQNPREPGRWLNPANSVLASEAELPDFQPGQWPRWNGQQYVLVPDHRGEVIHNALTREQKTCNYTGSLEDGWAFGELPRDLEIERANKIAEINAAVSTAIVSGFVSDALGSDHTYQSDRDDQINLIGAAQAGSDLPFKCADSNGVWAYRLHTAAQMHQALMDGAAVKLQLLQQGAVLKAQVEAAETLEVLDQIDITIGEV